MKYPALLGITGKAGSGKDTAFGFIEEWTEERGVRVARRAFGDSIKHSFVRMFIPDASRAEALVWCDRLKNNGALRLDDIRDIGGQKTTLTEEISVRLALQRYGTEGHRDLFGENFWLDQLLPIDDASGSVWLGNFWESFGAEPPKICVVTDVRFNDEAQRVVDLGGTIMYVERPGADVGDSHLSEQDIDPAFVGFTAFNKGGLEEFKQNVYHYMDTFYNDCADQ